MNKPMDSDMQHLRQSDDVTVGLRVNRTVPVWGVLTAIGSGIVMMLAIGINMYYGQQKQSDQIARLELQLVSINSKLDSITVAQATVNLKDAEQDFKLTNIADQIQNLRNRITIVEEAFPRRLPTPSK